MGAVPARRVSDKEIKEFEEFVENLSPFGRWMMRILTCVVFGTGPALLALAFINEHYHLFKPI